MEITNLVPGELSLEKQEKLKSMVSTMQVEMDLLRERADAIVVSGIDDDASINAARECRLDMKNKRLESGKFIGSLREEIKVFISAYTSEDKCLLKIKQYFDSAANEIENSLLHKEKTKERLLSQLKAARDKKRMEFLSETLGAPYSESLALMSDQEFELYVSALERKRQEEKEAAEIEAQKKAEEEERRQKEVARLQAEKRELERKAAIEKADAMRKAAEERAELQKKLAAQRAEAEKAARKQQRVNERLQAKLELEKAKQREAEKERKRAEKEAELARKAAEKERNKDKSFIAKDLSAKVHELGMSINVEDKNTPILIQMKLVDARVKLFELRDDLNKFLNDINKFD